MGGRTILHDLSRPLYGRSIGLLGPNGAGKSTLINTLLGFHAPASGTARIFGTDIREGDPEPSLPAPRGDADPRGDHPALLRTLRCLLRLPGATVVVFGAGILASFCLMYVHFDAGRDFVLNGPDLVHLRAYLLVAMLACLGYGAVFLAMSLLFRNPIVPAVIVLFWEGINGALPVWLKRFSVTYYLKPLFPVELKVQGVLGLFTVVAEPTTPWLAVSGLLAFAALVLAFVCWRVRRLEVLYSTD